jgi:predicted phage gp36 major capsid-like protein
VVRWRIFEAVVFIVLDNLERQVRNVKGDAEIEALRAAIIKAHPAKVRAENHLLR